MKILVGNNKLSNPGGSETYTYAVVAELVRLGHDVTCVTKGRPGIVSWEISKLGVQVHYAPVSGIYDMALLSHSPSIRLAERVRAFKVQTCHGIYPVLEQPVPGMDAYVAISEEVMQHLIKKGHSPVLIHNGVDCNRFSPFGNATHESLCVVLSLAHGTLANEMIQRVCKRNNWDLIIQNKYHKPIWDVENLINKADMVIGWGRSIYEAAACGRNVVVFDSRKYVGDTTLGDGFLEDHNFYNYLANNCTGRYSKRVYDAAGLQVEMEKYDPIIGGDLRSFAIQHLNIEKQVQKYLALVR